MAKKKKNHYVPITYLKRFAYELNKNEIFTVIRNTVKLVSIKNQAQKDYLYSIGVQLFEDRHNMLENYFGQHIESKYDIAMRETFDKDLIPYNSTLIPIIFFVLSQSCRTLFEKKIFDEGLSEIGIDQKKIPLLTFGMLVMANIDALIKKLNTCYAEILISPLNKEFITSDNPSTYWIYHQDEFLHVPNILTELFKDKDDLFLMCPVTPKYLIKVYINKNRANDKNQWKAPIIKINSSDVEIYNNIINYSKHSQSYSNNKENLLKLL